MSPGERTLGVCRTRRPNTEEEPPVMSDTCSLAPVSTLRAQLPPRSRLRPRLTEVLFGSNHTTASRYTTTTGEVADIAEVGYVEGWWSLACNLDRVGEGTIAFFARQGDGGSPPLAGFMVVTGDPEESDVHDAHGQRVLDADGNPLTQWYVPGRIHGWSEALWVPGADIATAGWPANRSPWGTNIRQFRNGEQLTPDLVRIVLSVLEPSLLRAIALEHEDVTGSLPWWW